MKITLNLVNRYIVCADSSTEDKVKESVWRTSTLESKSTTHTNYENTIYFLHLP